MIKNTAYGLRQAVLFMSLCEQEAQRRLVAEWIQNLEAEERLTPLRPVAAGLAHAVSGGTFDAMGRAPDGTAGRRFLGWSVGRHWLLGPSGKGSA